MCERTRLGARALVRHVEELLELRIVGEEARVEVSEQRLAVGGEDGSSCLDDGLLLVVEHGVGSFFVLFLLAEG